MAAGVMGVLGTLRILVDADTSKAQMALRKMGGQAGAFGAAMGTTMGLAGVAALRMGSAYDAAWDSIRIGTGATGDALAGLENDLKAVAGRVTDDFGLVGQVLADLNTRTGQTGEGLRELTESVLDLSRMTGTSAVENVALLTRLYGDWSIATEDQLAMNDQLMRVSQATGASITALAEDVVAFGAPLRGLGVDIEHAIAYLGKWEKEGVNVSTVLTGMRFAVKTFAAQGLDPTKAFPEFIEKLKTMDEATGLLTARQIVGGRAFNDFYRAAVEGRFDVEGLIDTMVNGADTVQGLADETRDAGDAWKELSNMVTGAVGDMMMPLAGISESMGNAIFLLPALAGALGNALGRLWTKAGGGAAVKSAAAAAGAVAGRAYAMGMVAAGKMQQILVAGWTRLGTLAGGRFGLAFKAAAILAIAALLVEVWNQFQAFQQKVAASQAALAGQVSAKGSELATADADKVLADFQGFSDKLKSLGGGLDPTRMLADTFGGKETMDALVMFGKNVMAQSNLTAGQLEQAVTLMMEAAAHAGARGNWELKEQFTEMANLLGMRVPVEAAADGSQTLFDTMREGMTRLVSLSSNAVLNQLDLATPIRSAFKVATAEVAKGFGSIKDALANPPQLISKADRLANMDKRMSKVMRNLHRAVKADDPWSIAYWEQARAKQQLAIDKLKGKNVASLKDIKTAYRKTGADVEGRWRDVRVATVREADTATEGVVGAASEALSGIDALDGMGSGYSYVSEIAAGMDAGLPLVSAAADAVAQEVADVTESGSPPKKGPLRNIDKWGKPLVDAWLGGIESQVGRVGTVGARLASALAPQPMMGGLGLAGATATGGRGDTYNVGVLVADDGGIDALDRRIERRKRLRGRGATRYNDPG